MSGAQKGKWYPLDNAANIYPVIQNSDWTAMFRLTAVMREEVDKEKLQNALDALRPRFPGFFVTLRAGVFWYYLETVNERMLVVDDMRYICRRPERGEALFRVCCYRNRISLEISHIIADGSGAMVLFQTLLAQYLRECGVAIPAALYDVHAQPEDEEWKDSFLDYARPGRRPMRREPYAYHPSGTPLYKGEQAIITGTLSVQEVLEVARKHKVSITEYLTATLMYVLYRMQLSERPRGKLKPVKVSVPVNLRKYYKTRTLRNFSQYLNPGIDPELGTFTFEETLAQVHHYFRFMFTEKNLNARMSQNVDAQQSLGLRVVPLFLKKAALRLVFELVGERVFSTVISNIGQVEFPQEMQPHIERVDLLLSTARHNAVECGVASCSDVLSITFTRHIEEAYVERMFFTTLVQMGLHVCVETNQD
ncbi:hypothetical protein LJC07_04295 [Christensenellaceae bacterium OttesenSCG-928-L17]|nr:hypothetical protein [Christensenellaceae bacterium OttesenSCG-928-L17]